MNTRDGILGLIFEAMREFNASAEPGRRLEIAGETVLVGESGKLDSLGFVNLVATIEENIERTCHKAISVMDIILGGNGGDWTAADLAARISEAMSDVGSENLLARGMAGS